MMTPATSIAARVEREPAPRRHRTVTAGEPAAALEFVARGLRGARARTGMSEREVVGMLERQGISISAEALRAAESCGVISLSFAACLADVYGTTTDALAGRRIHRQRLSLDDCPGAR
jgi:hypothetical protein